MLFSIFSVFDSAGFWISHLLSVLFNKLSLCRFQLFLMLWCSSSLVNWWEYSSIYCWITVGGASLMMWFLWAELHWWCDSYGRSFTDDVIIVGGASLMMWFLWAELHWWCDSCGRSFTDDVILVGGASLKNLSQVFLLWFYFYSDIFDRANLLLYIVKIYWSRNC